MPGGGCGSLEESQGILKIPPGLDVVHLENAELLLPESCPKQESRVTAGSPGFCFLMCPLLTCPSPLLARLQCPAEVIPDR